MPIERTFHGFWEVLRGNLPRGGCIGIICLRCCLCSQLTRWILEAPLATRVKLMFTCARYDWRGDPERICSQVEVSIRALDIVIAWRCQAGLQDPLAIPKVHLLWAVSKLGIFTITCPTFRKQIKRHTIPNFDVEVAWFIQAGLKHPLTTGTISSSRAIVKYIFCTQSVSSAGSMHVERRASDLDDISVFGMDCRIPNLSSATLHKLAHLPLLPLAFVAKPTVHCLLLERTVTTLHSKTARHRASVPLIPGAPLAANWSPSATTASLIHI
mmetsp:Transcript_101602/g.201800  ORF Transcript_101602/g.201800 Transcript_101602/m.201800 type:complete len:270 (-) Transcript_101602:58-867(-)